MCLVSRQGQVGRPGTCVPHRPGPVSLVSLPPMSHQPPEPGRPAGVRVCLVTPVSLVSLPPMSHSHQPPRPGRSAGDCVCLIAPGLYPLSHFLLCLTSRRSRAGWPGTVCVPHLPCLPCLTAFFVSPAAAAGSICWRPRVPRLCGPAEPSGRHD